MVTESHAGEGGDQVAEKADKKANSKSSLVLKAARSSFLDYGYDRTSVDMIAQRPGVESDGLRPF